MKGYWENDCLRFRSKALKLTSSKFIAIRMESWLLNFKLAISLFVSLSIILTFPISRKNSGRKTLLVRSVSYLHLLYSFAVLIFLGGWGGEGLARLQRRQPNKSKSVRSPNVPSWSPKALFKSRASPEKSGQDIHKCFDPPKPQNW